MSSMMRWPLLGCAVVVAGPRLAHAVCFAEACLDSPAPTGGGTIARAAAARLARMRQASESRADLYAEDGRVGGAAGTVAVESARLEPLPEQGRSEQSDCWELFAEGEAQSKLATSVTNGLVAWATDSTGAEIPARMLRAEELMQRALLSSQCARGLEAMGASRALRMVWHAKWLAQRDHARAAELRFREASREAAERGRTVLAQHALSQLGYFLARWGRPAEALEALLEAKRFGELDPERDPVAPFMLGVVGRQVTGGDVAKLREAEDRILDAGQQPTEELEVQRQKLQSDIRFWRAAELSPRRCLDAEEVVHALICLGSHLFHTVAQ